MCGYIICWKLTSHFNDNWLFYDVAQNEIKKLPKNLDELQQFVSRRLAVRQNVPHLSANDQRELVNVFRVSCMCELLAENCS